MAREERAKKKRAQLGGSHAASSDDADSDVDATMTLSQKKANHTPQTEDTRRRGRVPEEAIRKAVALGERTIREADKIAKEYGKQRGTILSYAGLSGKSTRSTSDWNRYQAWHASKYPKSEDGKCVCVLASGCS